MPAAKSVCLHLGAIARHVAAGSETFRSALSGDDLPDEHKGSDRRVTMAKMVKTAEKSYPQVKKRAFSSICRKASAGQ
jgi:hypothetical protein